MFAHSGMLRRRCINISTLDIWNRNPLRKCGHAASEGGAKGGAGWHLVHRSQGRR